MVARAVASPTDARLRQTRFLAPLVQRFHLAPSLDHGHCFWSPRRASIRKRCRPTSKTGCYPAQAPALDDRSVTSVMQAERTPSDSGFAPAEPLPHAGFDSRFSCPNAVGQSSSSRFEKANLSMKTDRIRYHVIWRMRKPARTLLRQQERRPRLPEEGQRHIPKRTLLPSRYWPARRSPVD